MDLARLTIFLSVTIRAAAAVTDPLRTNPSSSGLRGRSPQLHGGPSIPAPFRGAAKSQQCQAQLLGRSGAVAGGKPTHRLLWANRREQDVVTQSCKEP